jgi:hypothetical protein
MRKRKDYTGQKFNRLLVLEYLGCYKYRCLCDCGNHVDVLSINFTSDHTTSCGCRNLEHALENCTRINSDPDRPNNLAGFISEVRKQPTLHGLYRHGATRRGQVTVEYRAYCGAIARCTNPKNKSWSDYGGRGIQFHFTSFEQWLAELGPKPTPQHSVDRKDNDGHYEPGNLRWATRAEQNANQRPRRRAV